MSGLTDRLYSRIRHHNDLFGWDFMAKSCRVCHSETATDGNMPEGWTNVGHAPDCPVPEIEHVLTARDAATGWRHRKGGHPDLLNVACVECDQPWPCDAEQMRLRAEDMELERNQTIAEAVTRIEQMRLRTEALKGALLVVIRESGGTFLGGSTWKAIGTAVGIERPYDRPDAIRAALTSEATDRIDLPEPPFDMTTELPGSY